ncbi:MAG: hypothetical protein DYG91_01630 [Chloroflexi bacterium CFX7]|nr:hypothetical protein [Chloroflexi bacterium CFX7]RIL02095.1 MAG: hypothetical protein DCC78_08460 [bacterium]
MDGEMPDGWRGVKLREICGLTRDSIDPAKSPSEVFRHFSIPAFDAGHGPKLERGREILSSKFIVPPNSVLFSKLNLRIPRVWLPDSGPEELRAICSTEFLVLQPKPGRLSRRYLYHALRSERLLVRLVSEAAATTNSHQRIRPDDLLNHFVHTPPAAQQDSIVAILDAIDEAIEKTEAVIAATEDLRKALLQELLTHGVPGWHTEWKTVPGIGEIPVCWEVVRLGEVAREPIRNGFSAGTLVDETGWWLLTLGAVSHRGFVPAGARPTLPDARVRSFALQPGDLVVSRSNTSDRVGLAGIYTGTPNNCSYPDLLMRVRVNPRRALVELIEAQLLSGRGRTYFQQQARGTSSSMVKITAEILRAFPLVLPCLGEQSKILHVAAAVNDRLTNLADGRIALGVLKETMSDALLSGRVRVPMREGDAS